MLESTPQDSPFVASWLGGFMNIIMAAWACHSQSHVEGNSTVITSDEHYQQARSRLRELAVHDGTHVPPCMMKAASLDMAANVAGTLNSKVMARLVPRLYAVSSSNVLNEMG